MNKSEKIVVLPSGKCSFCYAIGGVFIIDSKSSGIDSRLWYLCHKCFLNCSTTQCEKCGTNCFFGNKICSNCYRANNVSFNFDKE